MSDLDPGSVLPKDMNDRQWAEWNRKQAERQSTVANLRNPTKGSRAFVTDANATTFAAVVAGGGANFVPVYADGTNWRIG